MRLFGFNKTLKAATGLVKQTGKSLDDLNTSTEEKMLAQAKIDEINSTLAPHKMQVILTDINRKNISYRGIICLGLFFYIVATNMGLVEGENSNAWDLMRLILGGF